MELSLEMHTILLREVKTEWTLAPLSYKEVL